MYRLNMFLDGGFSAASVRNFSTFGFVHFKLQNRLLPNIFLKLVYIKTNDSY